MTAAGKTGLRRIFFYGLFMDRALLESMGVHATLVGPAELPGYKLRIADRATLVRSDGAVAYGQLMDLSDDDAERLYAAPGLEGYAAGEVQVRLLNDQSGCEALSYHLPIASLGTATNAAYARRLADVVRENGFPDGYCRYIEQLADRPRRAGGTDSESAPAHNVKNI